MIASIISIIPKITRPILKKLTFSVIYHIYAPKAINIKAVTTRHKFATQKKKNEALNLNPPINN